MCGDFIIPPKMTVKISRLIEGIVIEEWKIKPTNMP